MSSSTHDCGGVEKLSINSKLTEKNNDGWFGLHSTLTKNKVLLHISGKTYQSCTCANFDKCTMILSNVGLAKLEKDDVIKGCP